MLRIGGSQSNNCFSSGVNDVNTNHHRVLSVGGNFDLVEILSQLSINLFEDVGVNCYFCPIDCLTENKLGGYALLVKERFYRFLVSGVRNNNKDKLVFIERESFAVIHISSTKWSLRIISGHFDVLGVLYFHTESTASLSHHFGALIGSVEIVLTVEQAPGFLRKLSGLGVLYFAACVIVPSGITVSDNQSWWIKNFSLNCMLLSGQFYIKLRELFLVADSREYLSDSLESIHWIFYLVLVNVSHFS